MKYKPIHSKEQYEKYCTLHKQLVFGENSEEKQDEIELLTILIKDWDAKNPLGNQYDPIELIQAFMEERKINQSELATQLSVTKGYISEILNYKKDLSKNMIRKLSEFLHIRQEALNQHFHISDKPRNHTLIE